MADKVKSVYVCSQCGCESPKWVGRCPDCGEWNSMVETVKQEEKKGKHARQTRFAGAGGARAVSLSVKEIPYSDEIRFSTGLAELDRVFGGGVVRGSAIIIGGEPGIGKSTILLQICQHLGKTQQVLYISGEESPSQIKLRANRLGVDSPNTHICAETEIETIRDTIEAAAPDVVIVDSIQTVYNGDLNSLPGSVSQIRECAGVLIDIAKKQNITMFIVGHINKDGAIAGPKVLEHMVDTVLYFEGDRNMSFRILRASKNRFGSTNEIGIFEMGDTGLTEMENPSMLFLSGKPDNVAGTCAVALIEGSRPILAEVQALLTPTTFGNPRRMASGIDYNRVSMLLAVIEKRMGFRVSTSDVYVNVIGGLRLTEPSSDLAVVLTCISSFKDIPIPDKLIAIGEVGLVGELRTVKRLEERIREAKRLGFTEFILPRSCKLTRPIDGVTIHLARNIAEAAVAAGLC